MQRPVTQKPQPRLGATVEANQRLNDLATNVEVVVIVWHELNYSTSDAGTS
jgi:hypothetical protein